MNLVLYQYYLHSIHIQSSSKPIFIDYEYGIEKHTGALSIKQIPVKPWLTFHLLIQD